MNPFGNKQYLGRGVDLCDLPLNLLPSARMVRSLRLGCILVDKQVFDKAMKSPDVDKEVKSVLRYPLLLHREEPYIKLLVRCVTRPVSCRKLIFNE